MIAQECNQFSSFQHSTLKLHQVQQIQENRKHQKSASPTQNINPNLGKNIINSQNIEVLIAYIKRTKMNMANQNITGSNQTYNFNNQQGHFNLMGNSNKINIKQCKGIFNVMGNGNQIVLCNSIFQANVNGNGNNFSVQGGELAIGINGNGNQINKVLPPRNDNPFWIDYGAKIRLMHVNGSYNILPENEQVINNSIESDNNDGRRRMNKNIRNNRNTDNNNNLRNVIGSINGNNGGTHRNVNWGYSNNNNSNNNNGMYFNNTQSNQYRDYYQPQWPQQRNDYQQNNFQPWRQNQYNQPQHYPFNPFNNMNGFNPFNCCLPNQMPGQQQMPMPSQPFNPFQALLSSQNPQNMNNYNSINRNSNRRIVNQRQNIIPQQVDEYEQQFGRMRRIVDRQSRQILNQEDNISNVAVSGRIGSNRNRGMNRGDLNMGRRMSFYDGMLLSDDEQDEQIIQRIRIVPNQTERINSSRNRNNRRIRNRFSFGQTVAGLTEQELNLLPRSKQSCKSGKCTICLQEMDVGSEITFLFCFHSFHSKCSLDWLARSANCPLCQLDIRPHLKSN